MHTGVPDGPLRNCEVRKVDVASGSIAGLHERRLAGSTIHEIGLPESGYSPPAPHAAVLTPGLSRRRAAEGREETRDLPLDSRHPDSPATFAHVCR